MPAIRRTGLADVVSVYDRQPDRAMDLASRIHARPYVGELAAMLRQERLDAVSICTPPWLHAAQTVQALEADVHVLVEKPMAMTEAECHAMSAAASAHGRQLCVAHNFLFSRAVSRVRERIASGQAGRIESVLGFQMSTPRRRLPDWYDILPGQLFFDEAPHLLYLTRCFLGPQEPVLRSASAIEASATEVQRTQSVSATVTTDQALGVMTMTFNASRAEWGFSVVGSSESYIVDLFRDQILVLDRGGRHEPMEVLRQTLSGLAQLAGGALVSGIRYSTHHLLYGHQEVINGFVNAVLDGGEVPVPGEEGANTIALLESICREAKLASVERP